MFDPVIDSFRTSISLVLKLLLPVVIVWVMYAFLGFVTGDIANGIRGANPWLFVSGQFIAGALGIVILSCFFFQIPDTNPIGRIKSSWQIAAIALLGMIIIKVLVDEIFPSQQFQALSAGGIFWGVVFRILAIVNILYAYELVKLKLETGAYQFGDAAKKLADLVLRNVPSALLLALGLFLIQIALTMLARSLGSDSISRLFFTVSVFGAGFWVWEAVVLLAYRTRILEESPAKSTTPTDDEN